MRCPFLEEVIVQYCAVCSIKKMIPRAVGGPSSCEVNHEECPTFREYFENKKIKEEKMKQEQERKVKASEGEKPCIWMKAGVIAYRMCTTDYDCRNCEFDQAIVDSSGAYVESPMVVEAIKKLRQLPGPERKCRYMLTGDLTFKLCSNNYECWHCPVDQYIQDTIEANPLLQKKREKAAAREKKVKGFTFREDYYYTPNHIWMKIEGEVVKIGIDEFASRIIGRIDRIDFPSRDVIAKGSECFGLGSGNRIVRMKLPVEANIVEKNETLSSDASSISVDPHNRGWLLKIKLSKEVVGDMMKGTKAKEWLEKEFDRLHEDLEEKVGITIADGGELAPDLQDRLTDVQWDNLIKKFLG